MAVRLFAQQAVEQAEEDQEDQTDHPPKHPAVFVEFGMDAVGEDVSSLRVQVHFAR